MQIINKKYFLWKYSFQDTEGMETYTRDFKLFN